MKTAPPIAANSYIFVLMVMVTAFLMITSILNLTEANRRISARYIQFAGLYNLAVSGNERALHLLAGHVAAHFETLDMASAILPRLYGGYLDNYIIYQDGEFLLSGYLMRHFRAEKNAATSAFLNSLPRKSFENSMGLRPHRPFFSYRMTLNTGTYHVRTAIEPHPRGHHTLTRAGKNDGPDILTYGIIEWPEFAYIAQVIPTRFEWRYDIPYWIPSELEEYLYDIDADIIIPMLLSLPEEERWAGPQTGDFAQWLLEYVRFAEVGLYINPLSGFAPVLTDVQQAAW